MINVDAMKSQRRTFLKNCLTWVATVPCWLAAQPIFAAWPAADFAETQFDAALKQLTKGKPIAETDKLELTIPEIAENGAVVPVTVSSKLEGILNLAIIAEQNPVPLVIEAQLSPALEPMLSARLKLASTSFVYAIAETDKVCYSVKKKVKVTIGGCGG